MANLLHILMVFLLGLGVFTEGLLDMIQTQDAVRTMVGEDARLTCQLTQPKKVVQITWKKMLPGGGTENVGSCNKRDGPRINLPFQGKVEFEDTGLQSSTIVVRNVTKADECCYRCLFNAHHEGSINTKTCLIVYVQPEPILHITKPNGTEMTVVSCSADARSAPTVTLDIPSHVGPSNNSTVHTVSPNGTVTVTSTVTLERFCSNSTQVRCVVLFSSGFIKEASRVIYSDDCDVIEKSEAQQKRFPTVGVCAAVFVGVIIIIIIIIIIIKFSKKRTRRRNFSEVYRSPKQQYKTCNKQPKKEVHLHYHQHLESIGGALPIN